MKVIDEVNEMMKCVVVFLVIMILSFSMVSCERTKKEQIENIRCNIVYIKDDRTDLCFAYFDPHLYGTTTSITNVPCDEKVMSQIQLDKGME